MVSASPAEAPTVSVVVPFHNTGSRTEDCIRSLLAQEVSGFEFEIIAVDNMSGDDTLDRLRRFEPQIAVLQCPTPGAGATRNRGVAEARGRFIAFMDGDCEADPGWLNAFVGAATEKPDTVIYGGPILAGDSSHPISVFSQKLYDQKAAVLADRLPYAVTCNMFLARALFVQAGLFDERLRRGQDVDFSWRAAAQCGARLDYVPDAPVYHENPRTLAALFAKGWQHGRGLAYLSAGHSEATGFSPARRLRDTRPWKRILRNLYLFVCGGPGADGKQDEPRSHALYWAVFDTGKQLSCMLHCIRYLLTGRMS